MGWIIGLVAVAVIVLVVRSRTDRSQTPSGGGTIQPHDPRRDREDMI